MSDWIVVVAYLVGWAWTARTVAIRMIDQEARKTLERRESWRKRLCMPHDDDGKPLVDTEMRILSVVMAALIGIVWPLALLVVLIAGRLRTPTEVAEADRVELEALRKLAREHGLPMPGGES